ncbi:uncharacterized protein LOC130776407 [Actinidia eriantha]|uniref:uncharacterized protein LOC130776407 n=1 Tax=Actinidia eriantha TaxID=165200 RepID=UPI00258C3EA9|nr:uncharacterized protein LOC130776407 [Actinidia eriantha]
MNPDGNLREPETEDMEVDDSVEILDDFPTCQTKREEIPRRDEIEKDVFIEILDEFPRCRMRKPTSNRADNEKDVSVEISVDPPTCRNRRETKLVPDLTSCEMRTKVTCKMHNNCNLQEFSPDIQSRRIQTRGSKHANPKMDVKLHLKRATKEDFTGGAIQSQIPLSASMDRIFIALQRARAFTSKNPFFVVYMRPSYISNKYGLNIPKDCAKKYLNGEQNNMITLRISEGRTWTVKRYSTTTSGKCTLGWSSFPRDNNLKVGDVCAFELDTGIELSLNVTIFRAGEYQNDDRKDKLVIRK